MSDAKPDNLQAALAQFAEKAVPPPAPARKGRRYDVRDTAAVLFTFALTILIFDSEGLLTWARRMDVGPVQTVWLSALAPYQASLDPTVLGTPRRALNAATEKGRQWFGVAEDPLLAEGWSNEEVPQLPSLPPLAAPADMPVAVENTVTSVLLVGDSLIAGSLGTNLQRALERDARFKVVEAFQTATGLSRPEIYDWMKIIPPLLQREKPKLIVCSLGANDATNLREDDRVVNFGEPGWRKAYAARVAAMMSALSASGARVLWLGLPPMRDARYGTNINFLNSIVAQTARRFPKVEFFELKMLVADKNGEYATFINGPGGQLVRYRLDDGIHYAPAGSRAITRWVVDWIYERYRKIQPR